jgi:hypothetical protein
MSRNLFFTYILSALAYVHPTIDPRGVSGVVRDYKVTYRGRCTCRICPEYAVVDL